MATIEARRQTKRGRFYEIPQVDANGTAYMSALYPSVTTILTCIGKPALVNWAAKVEREMVIEEASKFYQEIHNEFLMKPEAWKMSLLGRLSTTQEGQKQMQKAGEIGSLTHLMIENELNRRMGFPEKPLKPAPPETMEAAKRAFGHWLDWAKSVDLEPIASEQVIWSHKYKYAGTLDLLAKVNGKLAVIDWKTGKYVYNEAHLQNAAYRQAIREMGHGNPVEGYIVRLPKVVDDPRFEAVPADPEAPSMEVFLNVQALWQWQEDRQAAWESTKSTEIKFPSTHAGQSLEEGH